ncbi:SDR family NAD(P)-dependent oxidoreductase [uncultured Tateyamaria sp.]|uniref:SDR family NAD(P)-dependent oxidoreductase n=1 Tax=uncultured Tateyamaria sp. TaxID=455651 RepID=UPI002627D63E|nr:SDR family NAD(P)-dependent oxidoreductase [uncultured Tateyamaria sp.]
MIKTILITGSTDGIGLLTAKTLKDRGHQIILHGRSASKLAAAAAEVGGDAATYNADLSSLEATADLASAIRADHDHIDVLINNAGVYKVPNPVLPNGQDVRFVVNTLAPYALTKALLPIIPKDGRIINLSSAAQAPVDIRALTGEIKLDDMGAYAQSKRAIAIWTQQLAQDLPDGPVFLAVNPGSLLASKMVKEGFGVAGNDLQIGANILSRLALDDAFVDASGKYWDNDSGSFASVASENASAVMTAIKELTS